MPEERLKEHLANALEQSAVPERTTTANGKAKEYEFKIN